MQVSGGGGGGLQAGVGVTGGGGGYRGVERYRTSVARRRMYIGSAASSGGM